MDFPIFHLDFLGNRMLIAGIAVLHTMINHPLAVGGMLLIAMMEWWGYRKADPEWDRVAKRTLFVFFLITTSIGALTGVGIWLSASLVNPTAISSLIRVFFWAWFTEWIVFVTEVCLILAYYLTWDQWKGEKKSRHVRFGFILAFASWITMAVIVAILGFMMDTGNWLTDKSLFSALLNPIYLPQLAFRTPLAMVMAGAAVWVVLSFERPGTAIREATVSFVSRWMLAWSPFLILGCFLYWKAIPPSMVAHVSTALVTQEFESWYQAVSRVTVGAVALVALFAGLGAFTPRLLPRGAMVIPILILAALLGQFERVREFIRKPYVIAGYLYANGFRKDDYPLLQRDGVLKHAAFTPIREITPENELKAGKQVFALTCTRCHTVNGINGIKAKLQNMYGDQPWSEETVASYISSSHLARTFMPPFPGSDEERKALAKYLTSLQTQDDFLEGVQTIGLGQ